MEVKNNKIIKIINEIQELENEWEDYFEENTKISHIHKCTYDYIVNVDNKKLTIICDNNTGFSKNYEEKTYNKQVFSITE